MFHGGTMWGNWSTTVRRTRLTPSYANSANLASDSIKYEPKFSHLGALHTLLADNAATILNTPLPIPVSSQKKVRTISLAGAPGSGSSLTFIFNDDTAQTASVTGPDGKQYEMAPTSARIFNGATTQWYSQPAAEDGVGQPYLPATLAAGQPTEQGTGQLAWESWQGGKGTYYKTNFKLSPSLPAEAQVSINMTGFGQGNLFVNGVHVAYFNLQDGECFHPPGGVNNHGSCLGCVGPGARGEIRHQGSVVGVCVDVCVARLFCRSSRHRYIKERCDKPTQDCYHVAPEWLHRGGAENEILVFSQSNLPTNVTNIDPALASIVYRVDP